MKKCLLEGCGKPARKKFCCNKHKDKYHNRHNPRGIFAHLNRDRRTDEQEYYASTHPFDPEALGQE